MSRSFRRPLARFLGIIGIVFALFTVGNARAADPIAYGVLFFSPTCPHCHIVMEQVLPPLQEHYGAQLQILNVDVTQPDGQTLYQSMYTTFKLTEDRLGVPALVFGDTVMVGSAEIPSQLPGLIVSALAAGGNTWPAIPGFEAWRQTQTSGSAEATPTLTPFQRDPVGNSMAVTLLLIMVGSAVAVLINARPPFSRDMAAWRDRTIPILAVIGLAVAFYLSFVEVSGSDAVCGPVGDCNSVQQSVYAKIFGIPIGILGMLGYIVILAAWSLRRLPGQIGDLAANGLPITIFFGVAFSIYLTFLEPFVIGATCMWCLASAAVMTALLWVAAPQHETVVRRGKGKRVGAH